MAEIADFVWNFICQHPWIFLALAFHGAVTGGVAYLILLERKTASWVQDRIGPNRVGPMGLLQPIADGIKFILKEDYRPKGVDRVLFSVAPMAMIVVIIVSIAVIPFGGEHQVTRTVDVTGKVDPVAAAIDQTVPVNGNVVRDELGRPLVTVKKSPTARQAKTLATITYRYPFQIAKLNIGVLFIIAVLSLAVYGVVLGGWASNNKYSFLGGLRATAQMISYEIPMGLTLLAIVLMFGTLDLGEIVEKQAHYWGGIVPAWNVFAQPITFLLFLTCIHAEANRAPFDMAEAEQELVGGYHTEYSAMRFALFFLAEYAGMITTSAVCVALFFGGWHLPYLEWLPFFQNSQVDKLHPGITDSFIVCLIRAGVFLGKTTAIIFIFMWVRWSLPRFRFDQLMMLAWRALIPLSLALVLVTAIVMYFAGEQYNMQVGSKLALELLAANIGLIVLTGIISKWLPAAPLTNRKIAIPGSRYMNTPVAAGAAV